VARVERFGPLALQTVQQWLTQLAPGSRITVTPVVDLDELIAVDGYEAPDRLRNQVSWANQRHRSGVLVWTSPSGRSYAVDETGTLPRQ
jgi:hypothetical protein